MNFKKIKVIIIILIILISGLWIYKKWQWSNMGYKQPQRETIESIKNTISKHKLNGYHLIPRNLESYYFLDRYFNTSAIWVFDKKRMIKTSNLTSLDGNCYSDIISDICNSSNASQFNQKPNLQILNSEPFQNIFDSLLLKTQPIYNLEALDSLDQIIVMSWAKWMEISYRTDPQRVFESIENKNMKLILINLDYLDSWFPKSEELPILDL